MEGVMTPEEVKRLEEEFLREDHVGDPERLRKHEEFMQQVNEMRRYMAEQRTREEYRQMMDVNDVMKILRVSKSHGYKIIKKLNNELAAANYIVVRGNFSKAYFEKRVFGVDVDAR